MNNLDKTLCSRKCRNVTRIKNLSVFSSQHLTPDMFYCTSSPLEARQRHVKEIDPAETD